MKRLFLYLLCAFNLLSCDVIPVISGDEYILRDIFEETGGKNWKRNDNWCGYKPIEEWYGVTANDGVLLSLDLSDNNLKGHFRLDEFYSENMHSLPELNLSGNDFETIMINKSVKKLLLDNVGSESITITEIWGTADIDKVIMSNCKDIGELYINRTKEITITDCKISSMSVTDPENGRIKIHLKNVKLTDHLGGITISEDTVTGAEEFYQKYIYGEEKQEDDFKEETEEEKKDTIYTETYYRLCEIYESTGGDNWINNTNWCTDRPLNEWYGVTVNENVEVIGLDLSSNNLTGELRIEGSFPYLRELEVSDNNLFTISVAETQIEKLVLDHCVYNTDGVWGFSIEGIPEVEISSNKISSVEIRDSEDDKEYSSVVIKDCIVDWNISLDEGYESVTIEDCLVRCVDGNETNVLGRVTVRNTSVMERFDLYADNLTMLDSEVSGTLSLRNANVELTDCLVGGFDYSPEMSEITLNNVTVKGYDEEYYLYDGAASGYHDFRKFLNDQNIVESYHNDLYNLRLIYWQNGMFNAANWCTDKPLNEWQGVTTDAEGHVISLDLSGLNLTGSFKIAYMNFLENLDISVNRFTEIHISGTSIDSFTLSGIVTTDLYRGITLLGINHIYVNDIKNMPTIRLNDKEDAFVCKSLTINNCDFGRSAVIEGYVEEFIAIDSDMEYVGGSAREVNIDGCVMASCGIHSDYLNFTDSETYEGWDAYTNVKLNLTDCVVYGIYPYYDLNEDAIVSLNNATLVNNGVSKTFTKTDMTSTDFTNLMKESGLY